MSRLAEAVWHFKGQSHDHSRRRCIVSRIDLKISALLTFDNVLIMSAVDAETGACYTKLISQQGESGEFIDTPLDQIPSNSTPPVDG